MLEATDEFDLLEADVAWSLRQEAPALFEALVSEELLAPALFDALAGSVPMQRRFEFVSEGGLVRPERHVRACYLQLSSLGPGAGKGCVAIKGTEPALPDFADIVTFLSERWSTHTWTVGGGGSQLMGDRTLVHQVDRFPVTEGKPPAMHPLWDAQEEALCATRIQEAHLRRYGCLARLPTPLLVCRLPAEITERAFELVRPHLAGKALRIVESELQEGLGIYIYHYPSLPLRLMHQQVGNVPGHATYEERSRRLAQLMDPRAVMESWLDLTAKFLLMGWVPTDPANFSRGYCLQPQNLVIDGGMVDMNSLREFDAFATSFQLEFAVRRTVRELTQSLVWLLLGSEGAWYEDGFPDAYTHVWNALRQRIEREGCPPQLARLFGEGDPVDTLVHGIESFPFHPNQIARTTK